MVKIDLKEFCPVGAVNSNDEGAGSGSSHWAANSTGKKIVLLRLPKDMVAADLAGLRIRYIFPEDDNRMKSIDNAPGEYTTLAEFSREFQQAPTRLDAEKMNKDSMVEEERVAVKEKFAIQRINGSVIPVSLALPSKKKTGKYRLAEGFDEFWTISLRVDSVNSSCDGSQADLSAATKGSKLSHHSDPNGHEVASLIMSSGMILDETALEERSRRTRKSTQPKGLVYSLSCTNVSPASNKKRKIPCTMNSRLAAVGGNDGSTNDANASANDGGVKKKRNKC